MDFLKGILCLLLTLQIADDLGMEDVFVLQRLFPCVLGEAFRSWYPEGHSLLIMDTEEYQKTGFEYDSKFLLVVGRIQFGLLDVAERNVQSFVEEMK